MQRLLATIDTHPRSKAGMVISTGEIKHIEDERDRGRTCQDTHDTGRNGLPTHAGATQAQRYRPPVTSPPPPPRHTHSPEVGGEEEAKPKAAWIGAPQSLVRDTTPLSERTEQEPRNARGRKRAFHPPSRVGLQRSCRRGMREEEGLALGWRAHNAIVSANKTHPHAYTRAGHTISRAREGEEATLSTRLGDGDSTQSQKKSKQALSFSVVWTPGRPMEYRHENSSKEPRGIDMTTHTHYLLIYIYTHPRVWGFLQKDRHTHVYR